MSNQRPQMRIRTPEDVIAAVPYLLGFHPSDSIVLVAYGGPHGTCALRQDLPPQGGDPEGERLAAVLTDNGFERAVLLGYGPPGRVAAAVGRIRPALEHAGVEVAETMRVGDGRWWSLDCASPCCPPEGRRYDIAATEIAAEATLAGQVVLPGRSDLVRSIASLGLPMREATTRAEQRWFDWARQGLSPARIRSRAVREGTALLDDLSARVRGDGPPPTGEEVAWLGVLLTETRVRDEAWIRIDPDDPGPHLEFWRYVVRRVEEPYITAPAVLLAYAAYSTGDGALANIALDRAAPDYPLAWLLREIMAAGIPPSAIHPALTARELSSHDEDLQEEESQAS
ncbi:DUF4192 domain-containing protein [Actinomadura kijaniata]|uniref:DUF4192 domain-containing protein n=1 Tax=Actinomadura kijaniata TaxID=46161 RepID=UPI00082B358E|nr:DUF4192 domain-containing protein [Actinomadura kijaniata]